MDTERMENESMDTENTDAERADNTTTKAPRGNLIYVVVGILAIAVIALALMLSLGSGDETVATVGGEKITKDELYNRLVEYYGPQTLDAMITSKIVEMEFDKADITISSEEFDNEMNRVILAYGGMENVQMQLASQGMTIDSLEKDVLEYMKTVKLLEQRITISDEEIREYFEENKAYFDTPEQVEASHILVDDEETAKDIKKQLDEGADFAQLASQYSKDSSNAQNGGQLGFFGRGRMVESFEEAAFSMAVGEISDPVQSEYGYHIIKVTNKQEAKAASLEDNSDVIEEMVRNGKMKSEYPAWLAEKQVEYEIYNSLTDKK